MQVVRSDNDIHRDEATGRLTYSNGAGDVTLITQEYTHRGFSRNLGEPEMAIRVRLTEHYATGSIWRDPEEVVVHERSMSVEVACLLHRRRAWAAGWA